MRIWLASLKRVKITRQVKETSSSLTVTLTLTSGPKRNDSKKNGRSRGKETGRLKKRKTGNVMFSNGNMKQW